MRYFWLLIALEVTTSLKRGSRHHSQCELGEASNALLPQTLSKLSLCKPPATNVCKNSEIVFKKERFKVSKPESNKLVFILEQFYINADIFRPPS
jgi:hypothetical protein